MTIDTFSAANAALAERAVLDVDDLRLMYRLELAGEVFYRRLAEGVAEAAPEAATLFERNGREERGHADRIRRALVQKLGTWQPSEDDLRPLEVDVPFPLPVELLPHIAAGEVAGDEGYQRWADAEPDPEVQRLLRLNGREETIHAERVRQALALLGGEQG